MPERFAALIFPVNDSLVPEALVKVSFVTVVLASVEAPLTFKLPDAEMFVAEAFCKDVLPLTLKMLEMVVEPVMANVFDVVLKVKLVEVPIMLLPWPNKMSLAVKFCKEMLGVRPPLEVTEPLPETEVTKVEEA